MTNTYQNGRKVEDIRYYEVYEFQHKIESLLEQNGFHLLAYPWRFTQKKDKQSCSVCHQVIESNRRHFLIKQADKEFGLRIHAGKCLQEYLTRMLNRATELLGGTVDTSWDDMLRYDHPELYRRRP